MFKFGEGALGDEIKDTEISFSEVPMFNTDISPEEAIKKEFDKVVIASVDGRFIAEAREKRASMDVDVAKVIDFTGYKSKIRKILVSVGMLNE